MGRKKKTHEEFVAEVKELVGDEYSVEGIYNKSSVKVGMKHNKCSSRFEVRPNEFLRGCRCPSCYGTQKKTTEVFKREVFNLVGNDYTVLGEYINTSTKIELMHEICKNKYLAVPNGFLHGNRCPHCHPKSKKTTEIFKREVFNLVGNEYVVLGEYLNGNSKLKLRHNVCGEMFSMRPRNFLGGNRCPKCAESKGEQSIRRWLASRNIEFVSEHPIKYDKTKMPLFLDFLACGVAVEYDGAQHYRPVEHFGGEVTLRAIQRRDRIKDKYCADHGIPLIRIPYWEYDNIDAILTEKLLPLLDGKSA